ncbi:MAG: class II glutamine amidotransferase [Candidatus Jordarchaeales archaeon]
MTECLVKGTDMCDILAMCFSKPVTASFSLRGFKMKGKFNYHGWGVAWYQDGAAQIVKEPVTALRSRLFDNLLKNMEARSEIFIAHVRRASDVKLAPPSIVNTHPFLRELKGKTYVFAHNGSLKQDVKRMEFKRKFPLSNIKPLGETGSEYIFCHLLACIEKEVEVWDEAGFSWLADKLAEINEYIFLNCAMSDGDHLFLYHDAEAYNGMALTLRRAPFPVIRLMDDEEEVILQEEKGRDLQGVVATTLSLRYSDTPVYLTNEKWTHVEPGKLLVFRKGREIYQR